MQIEGEKWQSERDADTGQAGHCQKGRVVYRDHSKPENNKSSRREKIIRSVKINVIKKKRMKLIGGIFFACVELTWRPYERRVDDHLAISF